MAPHQHPQVVAAQERLGDVRAEEHPFPPRVGAEACWFCVFFGGEEGGCGWVVFIA